MHCLWFICSGPSICLGKKEENPCLKEMVNISKADIFLTKCVTKMLDQSHVKLCNLLLLGRIQSLYGGRR